MDLSVKEAVLKAKEHVDNQEVEENRPSTIQQD
jgi:hypothetical protein